MLMMYGKKIYKSYISFNRLFLKYLFYVILSVQIPRLFYHHLISGVYLSHIQHINLFRISKQRFLFFFSLTCTDWYDTMRVLHSDSDIHIFFSSKLVDICKIYSPIFCVFVENPASGDIIFYTK